MSLDTSVYVSVFYFHTG